jgi:hypothetical protein
MAGLQKIVCPQCNTEISVDDVLHAQMRDGVLVCSMNLAVPLAAIIHDKLEAVAREKGKKNRKNEKMEILYQYLTGVQFKQRIEAILEAFRSLGDDIAKEKQYFTRKWASQEKQIGRIMTNTIGIYGDIDGMVSLPKIPTLEMDYHNSLDGGGEELV